MEIIQTLAPFAVLYMAPTIMALALSHKDALSICVVNVFFGWTLIGWALSLTWALKS